MCSIIDLFCAECAPAPWVTVKSTHVHLGIYTSIVNSVLNEIEKTVKYN